MNSTTPDDAGSHRRVYGRGFFDGLRTAGITDPDEFMNQARLRAAEQSLNGMARKVLDVVPRDESWPVGRICNELARKGSNPDVRVVTGCLSTLRDDGLVREPQPKHFIRVMTKPKPKPELAVMPSVEKTKEENKVRAEETPDPLESLTLLARSARETARQLVDMAADIEGIADKVDKEVQRIREDTGKLRQLKALLKDI